MKSLATDGAEQPLFERDFVAWCSNQGQALRAKRWADLDTDLLAEEIEALGRAQRRRLKSYLEIVTLPAETFPQELRAELETALRAANPPHAAP
jgi:hypothetical protein